MMGMFGGSNPGDAASADPNYFQRLNNILQAQRAAPGGAMPGSPGAAPQQPPGYSGLNPDQIAMVKQQGYFMSPNAVLPNAPNGQPQQWQQPPGYSGLNPSQIQAVNQQGFYTDPSAVQQNPSLWNRLVGALGQIPPQFGRPGAMPGATTGMPSGAASMAPPATPVQAPPQMMRPQGMAPTFQGLFGQPAAGGGGNAGLMQQYMMLQQMMRGS